MYRKMSKIPTHQLGEELFPLIQQLGSKLYKLRDEKPSPQSITDLLTLQVYQALFHNLGTIYLDISVFKEIFAKVKNGATNDELKDLKKQVREYVRKNEKVVEQCNGIDSFKEIKMSGNTHSGVDSSDEIDPFKESGNTHSGVDSSDEYIYTVKFWRIHRGEKGVFYVRRISLREKVNSIREFDEVYNRRDCCDKYFECSNLKCRGYCYHEIHKAVHILKVVNNNEELDLHMKELNDKDTEYWDEHRHFLLSDI